MSRLEGKVAFITGAGAGIAKASAVLFAAEGAQVVIAELDAQLGRQTEQEIRSAGGDATFVATDVTDDASVRNAIERTRALYGRLTVLFNCVGTSSAEDTLVEAVDMSLWEPTLSTNLRSAFLGCRHGIPELKRAGGGAVINMASWMAFRGYSQKHIYTAAKGAIVSFTRSLAGAYAADGIRANAIAPGNIRTERAKQRHVNPQSPQEKQASAMRNELAQRYPFSVGEPLDIAHIALFLASDESRMITGTTIMADGGRNEY
jgi:NAD(P)-dependent dehydrogenase (short-subunit alcohol dehydrogenase family)